MANSTVMFDSETLYVQIMQTNHHRQETQDWGRKSSQMVITLACLMVVLAGMKAAAGIMVPMACAFFLAVLSFPLLAWRGHEDLDHAEGALWPPCNLRWHHREGRHFACRAPGTRFTCFTGTKVQILTQKAWWVAYRAPAQHSRRILELLALLVRQHKY